MVNYKDLGLVNTREMFAKAIKGGSLFLRSFFDRLLFPARSRGGILLPSHGNALRDQLSDGIGIYLFFMLLCHTLQVLQWIGFLPQVLSDGCL